MPDRNDVIPMLKVRTDERTFKSIGDAILNMKVVSDSEVIKRCALVNSAKSFIDGQLRANINSGYRPLEEYLTEPEMAWGEAKVRNVKAWLSYNMDVFEKKQQGGMLG